MTTQPLRSRVLRHVALWTAAVALSVALLFLVAVTQTVWQFAGLDFASVSVTSKGLVFKPRPIEVQPAKASEQPDKATAGPEYTAAVDVTDWTFQFDKAVSDPDHTTIFKKGLTELTSFITAACRFVGACQTAPVATPGTLDFDWSTYEYQVEEGPFQWGRSQYGGSTGRCGCDYRDDDGNIVVCFSCLIESAAFSLQYIVLLAAFSWYVISGNFASHCWHVRAWWGTRHQYQSVGAGSLMLWLAELFFTPDEIAHNLLPHVQDARVAILLEPHKAPTIRSSMYVWAVVSATVLTCERLLRPVLRTLR